MLPPCAHTDSTVIWGLVSRGYSDIETTEVRDQTTDLSISRRATLPPELELCVKFKGGYNYIRLHIWKFGLEVSVK